MNRISFILFLLFLPITAYSQPIQVIDSSQTGVSFRGLSVVNDTVLWVSGSKGTVGKSTNGGRSFTWIHPPGFEKRDFRDIEAFDVKTAILMVIDSPAVILKTTDGGATWKTVYEKHLKGIFLDAMSFKDPENGVCVGDPIKGRFWILETKDGGNSWQEIPEPLRLLADSGEACFAASGSNIQFIGDSQYQYGFVSGGLQSRLSLSTRLPKESGRLIPLPITTGAATAGANSMAVYKKRFVVAGGDFNDPGKNNYTCIYSVNQGKSWQVPATLPSGYKSCVIFITGLQLLATGLSGTDVSTDGAENWRHISDMKFHVVQKAKKGSAVFLAGGNGRIGSYTRFE